MDLYCVPSISNFQIQVDLARADGATPLFKACHKVGSTIHRSHHHHHLHHRHHGPSSYVTEQFKTCHKIQINYSHPMGLGSFSASVFLLITAQPQYLPPYPTILVVPQGHDEVVRELLEHDPILGNLANGSTPLHAAALSGHHQV